MHKKGTAAIKTTFCFFVDFGLLAGKTGYFLIMRGKRERYFPAGETEAIY